MTYTINIHQSCMCKSSTPMNQQITGFKFTWSQFDYDDFLITPSRNRGGVIFSLQFLCVYHSMSVCLTDCLSVSAYEQNSSRKDELIWTRFALNGCLPHWLEPYWNFWLWVKGQSHSDVIPIFLHNSLLTSQPCISVLSCLIKMKFGMSLRYTRAFYRISMKHWIFSTCKYMYDHIYSCMYIMHIAYSLW